MATRRDDEQHTAGGAETDVCVSARVCQRARAAARGGVVRIVVAWMDRWRGVGATAAPRVTDGCLRLVCWSVGLSVCRRSSVSCLSVSLSVCGLSSLDRSSIACVLSSVDVVSVGKLVSGKSVAVPPLDIFAYFG